MWHTNVGRIHGRESCFGTTLWAMTSESWTTMWALHDMRTVNHDVAIQLDMVCAVRMWVSCLVHRIHGRGSCFVTDLLQAVTLVLAPGGNRDTWLIQLGV